MILEEVYYKKEFINTQAAILNVLDDYKKDAENVLNSRKALLNILEDLELSNKQLQEEKAKSDNLIQDFRKFKLAVENATSKMFFTDPDFVITYANKTAETVTGYANEEIVGKNATEHWGELMPQTFYENLWKTIKTDKKVFTGEMLNKKKNGQIYNSLLRIIPILDDSNEVLFFVGIKKDITKEKEMDKAKTELISLASHQLLTPLSIVSWYVEMLLAGDAGEMNAEQKKYLNEIYVGNKRMVELVNSLLGVSRMELGTFIPNPVLTDVTGLIKDICNEQKINVQEKEITLDFVIENNIPIIETDTRYLNMVIQNLISNAIKYTPKKGSITISIALEKDKKNILFKVIDTGIGIPAKEKDKIFARLFRAQNALESGEIQGTGLGLYIVKSIVENSGGKVWFESVENVGTTFFVRLPI